MQGLGDFNVPWVNSDCDKGWEETQERPCSDFAFAFCIQWSSNDLSQEINPFLYTHACMCTHTNPEPQCVLMHQSEFWRSVIRICYGRGPISPADSWHMVTGHQSYLRHSTGCWGSLVTKAVAASGREEWGPTPSFLQCRWTLTTYAWSQALLLQG